MRAIQVQNYVKMENPPRVFIYLVGEWRLIKSITRRKHDFDIVLASEEKTLLATPDFCVFENDGRQIE